MHIGLIPDGNRRWAKAMGMSKFKGHEKGAAKIKEFLEWAKESGVEEVSVFILSSENAKRRSEEEIYFLKKLLMREMEEYEKRIGEYDLYFVGEYWVLGERIKSKIEEIMRKSKEQKKEGRMRVNFLVGYGGRWEVEQAYKNKKNIENIKEGLIIKRDVDLIIRTGRERRLSNFLLYQSAYAEIYFSNKFWPAFTKEDFNKILEWFNERERRFGK